MPHHRRIHQIRLATGPSTHLGGRECFEGRIVQRYRVTSLPQCRPLRRHEPRCPHPASQQIVHNSRNRLENRRMCHDHLCSLLGNVLRSWQVGLFATCSLSLFSSPARVEASTAGFVQGTAPGMKSGGVHRFFSMVMTGEVLCLLFHIGTKYLIRWNEI